MSTAGWVLVGGKSSRMGRNKALLPLHGSTLVENVALAVKAAAGNVALLGPAAVYGHLGFECLPDPEEGLGPIGGILSALRAKRGDLNLIVACDMPELSDALLIGLLAEAQRLNAPCLVAAGSDGQVHPLCGVYRADCLNEVEEAVADYRLRLMDLIADLKAVKWRTELPLTNCNTPEEWSAISLV